MTDPHGAPRAGDDHPEHDPAHDPAHDPVLERRARVARLATNGQRIGYACFALFALVVIAAFATGFPPALTTVATAALVAGSVVLAPAMVVSYAVKAADRADRDDDWR